MAERNKGDRSRSSKPPADDEAVRRASTSGHMGPGRVGGGYAHQQFTPDRTGGTYGGQESGGGSYVDQSSSRGNAATSGDSTTDPLAKRQVAHGRQHMSGVYGSPAYGRAGPVDGRVPYDPSQRNPPAAAPGIVEDDNGEPDRKQGGNINAQIGGATPGGPIARGSEGERDAPGISTDKRSDDTRD